MSAPRLPTPVTYSASVTLTLTHDCPWRCRYCGFRSDNQGLISEADIERLLEAAESRGARELLLLSGENPASLPHIALELEKRGYRDFIDFADDVSRRALARGILPHSNLGALDEHDLLRLRETNPSGGLMLENSDADFNERVAPSKSAEGRLATIEAAGRARWPFTSGILIGLGESVESRFESLRALASVHARHGHLQEIIIQNYVPNEGSRWEGVSPRLEDYLELIAYWREVAPDVPVQIPPNLNPFWVELLPYIDDLGGISELGDEVNPLNRWAKRREYADAVSACGRTLEERLPVYQRFLDEDAAGRLSRSGWLSDGVRRVVHRLKRLELRDAAKARFALPASSALDTAPRGLLDAKKRAAHSLRSSRSAADAMWSWPLARLREEAAALNHRLNGDVVTYVVNRNANFTNVCNVGCAFCGFQRKASDDDAYTRSPEEVVERLAETPQITEVCMQGGINPKLPPEYYFDLLRAIRRWRADIHIHAFSPMEIHALHRSTGWSYDVVLGLLQEAGLDTIPGTAAEILDDEVRGRISSRKLGADQWVEIVRTAHGLGIRSTATIMFGHIETWAHIRAHFDTLRAIQEETGGFTEFVPLLFIPDENPLGHDIVPNRLDVRRKVERIYPLARLYLGEAFPHLQTSWVKLGVSAATESLDWGCDDFGGTLFEESITRASGGTHGESLSTEIIEHAITSSGKTPRRRTTLYEAVGRELAAV